MGGVLYGFAIGTLAYWMLKRVDDYSVEVLITLALTTGGYTLAEVLHLSAPIAIVVAGLLIGNHGRSFAMSDRTREHLDTFWELVDEILTAPAATAAYLRRAHADARCFLLNTGDLLAMWTNDRWPSTLHRVPLPTGPAGARDCC